MECQKFEGMDKTNPLFLEKKVVLGSPWFSGGLEKFSTESEHVVKKTCIDRYFTNHFTLSSRFTRCIFFVAHQPQVPAPPLKGPFKFLVIQPP